MERFRAQAKRATAALPGIQVDARTVAEVIEHPKWERRLVAALQERTQGNAARFVRWRGALPAGSTTSCHSAMSC
jgi:hypothetical protein